MKDAYYFPHDSNAKDDPKCIMLIEELGMEGYGIFWMLIETLRDQPEYKAPVSMIPGLARRYNSTAEKVKAVVIRYELFEVDEDEFFFSESFTRRMKYIDEKRQKRSIAGRKGNEVRWGSQSDRNRIASKVKESKVKEIKEGIHPLCSDLKNVNSMKEPLTLSQGEALISEYGKDRVKDILLQMENYKPLVKKNLSANLTVRNWIKRDWPKQENQLTIYR